MSSPSPTPDPNSNRYSTPTLPGSYPNPDIPARNPNRHSTPISPVKPPNRNSSPVSPARSPNRHSPNRHSTPVLYPPTYEYHNPYIPANHLTRPSTKETSFTHPHLKPNYRRILDVGCGSGTTTASFSPHVPGGSVVGIDISPEAIAYARFLAHSTQATQVQKLNNVSFEVGDIVAGLAYPDAHFDVVFCNQVLLYIENPVAALREMKRLCKPGGFVACREMDFPVWWYPYLPGLQISDKYMYAQVVGQTQTGVEYPQNPPHGEEYRGGSLVHVWAREAGFNVAKMKKGVAADVKASEGERRAWAEIWALRLKEGGMREKWKALGATDEELEVVVRDLEAWADDVDGWYAQLHAEVICWV